MIVNDHCSELYSILCRFVGYFPKRFRWSSVFPYVRVAKAKSLKELSSFSVWNAASVKIFAYYKILRTCELYRLRFTYANRQLIPWRLSAASEKPEMRAAGWSLMKSRHREGSATAAAAAATTAAGKGNEREGRGRRNEGSGRSIKRKRKRSTTTCGRKGEREEEERRGRLDVFGNIKRRAGRWLLRLDR